MREPGFPKRQLGLLLKVWSVSKLRCLLNCPRMFEFQYIRKAVVPQSPWKLFGTAVHRMFEDFFHRGFKTRETFISAGRGLWAGVQYGDHGPGSFSPEVSAPVEVNWGYTDPAIFYGMMTGALGRFWDRNIDYRGADNEPLTEQQFTMELAGKTVRGIVDRVQPVGADGYEIWDYKPSKPSQFGLDTDLQVTLYNLWGLRHYGKSPERMGIYSYKAKDDPMVWCEPRGWEDFDKLVQLFFEAGDYVYGVIYGYLPSGETLTHLPMGDVETGCMSPRGVVGGPGCVWCEYKDLCLGMERGRDMTTAQYVLGPDTPITLPMPLFPPTTRREQETAKMRSRVAGWEQRPGVKDAVEPEFLALPPKPRKTTDSDRPTKYGRCGFCGYALNKAGKCVNCGAWYDAEGNYDADKTWKRRKRKAKDDPQLSLLPIGGPSPHA